MLATAPSLPRRAWSAIWRTTVLAVLGFIVFLVGYGSILPADGSGASPENALIASGVLLDLLLAAASLALYNLRSRAPLAIPLVVTACSAFSWASMPAAAALLLFVAARGPLWRTCLLVAAHLAATTLDGVLRPFPDTALWEVLATGAGAACVLVLIGTLIGLRRRLRSAQARELAADQAARVEQARSQERARVAREMHDVLGHRLSLLAVHAGALEYRKDLSAEQTAQTAGVIADNARLALDEVRGILGVLREGAHGAAVPPQPTADDIAALIHESRASGANVEVESLETAELPPRIGRHLFRITQEILTNARKHAPNAPVRLSLRASPGGNIRLAARNAHEGTTPRGGLGLVGIAERVELLGGTVQVHDEDSTFIVDVTVPWDR